MQVRTRTRTEISRRQVAQESAASADDVTSLPYRAGIDGLRALAVIAIVVADTGAGALPGGFLGIEILFVLTGFLLTSLLLVERRQRGYVDLVRFWARRARRALPAVLTVIGGVSIIVLTLRAEELPRLGPDVRSTLLGMSNWQLALGSGVGAPTPSPLHHLWSVAIGAQFVVWWALVFSVSLSRLGRRRLRGVALLLAMASALGMGLLSVAGETSRALYGTDTRASGLLLGALAALAFPPSAWHERVAGVRARRLRLLGLMLLAALFALLVAATPQAVWVPRGGLFLVAVLTALVIAVVLRSAEFDRMLGVAPLRWLGRRANAIYLWHWPVVIMIGVPAVATPPMAAFYIGATLVLADVTYRFVTLPLSRVRPVDGTEQVGRPGLAVNATAVACGVATVAALLTGPG
jgi:peptidoglycan/LPS O-acetylase OafA/YrhL